MKRLMQLLIIILIMLPLLAFGADVTLQWDANTEPGLAGYHVYQADRFDDKTGPWAKITSDLVTEATYIVIGLDDKNYAWLVTAVDTEGNQSFVSNMVERYDRTPPFSPTNLRK